MSDFKTCLEEIKARIPVSTVVSKHVKLKKYGREFVGLSPFTAEKSPSFTVNDQKRFWHCFSSGLHGDIFSFLERVENVSFMEAVERLAAQASVTLPRTDMRDVRAIQHKALLRKIVHLSAQFFQQQLREDAGAQQYLEGRGIRSTTVQTFNIGYASESEVKLKNHLLKAGFLFEDIVAAGLISQQEGSNSLSHDKFRGRIMFPIANERGETVAFGGRILMPHPRRPKYLNSPQTDIFHKGHILYNYHHAQPVALSEKEVFVVEGYMDVIGLHQVGIRNVVATMGTALTEEQIQLLWRLSPTPTLCFDGDTAGLHAVFQVAERILPILKPGHSLNVCLLSGGLDPFDIAQKSGAQAFKDMVAQKQPLVDVLWHYLTHQKTLHTPEEKALLEARTHTLVENIADKSVRAHYKRELDKRLWHLFRPTAKSYASSAKSSLTGSAQKNAATPALKQSSLVRSTNDSSQMVAHMLLLVAIYHPSLIYEYADRLLNMNLKDEKVALLRQKVLDIALLHNSIAPQEVWEQLTACGMAPVLAQLQANPIAKNERYAQKNGNAFTPEEVSAWFSLILDQWEMQQAFTAQIHLLENSENSLQQLQLLHQRLKEKNEAGKKVCEYLPAEKEH